MVTRFGTSVTIGRRVETLALPGDDDVVLKEEIRRAIRRENQLTWREYHAKAIVETCYKIRMKHPYWYCTTLEPCFYCEELNDL